MSPNVVCTSCKEHPDVLRNQLRRWSNGCHAVRTLLQWIRVDEQHLRSANRRQAPNVVVHEEGTSCHDFCCSSEQLRETIVAFADSAQLLIRHPSTVVRNSRCRFTSTASLAAADAALSRSAFSLYFFVCRLSLLPSVPPSCCKRGNDR